MRNPDNKQTNKQYKTNVYENITSSTGVIKFAYDRLLYVNYFAENIMTEWSRSTLTCIADVQKKIGNVDCEEANIDNDSDSHDSD